MEAIGVERAAILGNSMGGYFGLVFALAHPQRVSKLVLIGEPAGSAPRISLPHTLIGMRGINSLLYATILNPGADATRRSFRRLLVANINRVPSDYLECMTAASLIPGAVESWVTMVENVTRWNRVSTLTYALRPELRSLKLPTLFIWGDKDRFCAPVYGQEMAQAMPNALIEVLVDAGHLPWLDQPELTAQLVEAFLG